jgi:predicted DNA-binding protein
MSKPTQETLYDARFEIRLPKRMKAELIALTRRQDKKAAHVVRDLIAQYCHETLLDIVTQEADEDYWCDDCNHAPEACICGDRND